ncbi:MAG: poly(3-hydroxyalkanoate) synthetase, partial [Pseudolabrys sp.]
MDRYPGGQFPYAAFFWPALAAASAGEIASSFAAHFLGSSGDADGDRVAQEPQGATPSKIALELHSVRLRDFTAVKSGVPALLCTPLALHGATLADLAAGHS